MAIAGLKGVIRILAVAFGKCTADLTGHTQAVNDVKFHPKMNDLLFSASKVIILSRNIQVHYFLGRPLMLFMLPSGPFNQVVECGNTYTRSYFPW